MACWKAKLENLGPGKQSVFGEDYFVFLPGETKTRVSLTCCLLSLENVLNIMGWSGDILCLTAGRSILLMPADLWEVNRT